MNFKCNMFFFLFCLISSQVFAELKLNPLFTNNMVLQRDKAVNIWGTADAGQKVTVTFLKNTVTAKANRKGEWRVILKAKPAGGPYELTVKAKKEIKLKNVMMGDVWLCSGQSNMGMTVRSTENAAAAIKAANFPNIRFFTVKRRPSANEENTIAGGNWSECSPKTVKNFSAAGYFFGKKLHKDLNVAIGLINSSWGGTAAELWMSKQGFESVKSLKPLVKNLISREEFIAALKGYAPAVHKFIANTFPKAKVDPFAKGWQKEGFDDSSWNSMALPGYLEKQKPPINQDGIIWFRKTFEMKNVKNWKTILATPGRIDDFDEMYVNGKLIGKTGPETANYWNKWRVYKIPNGLLKKGKNTFAIRLTDIGGWGGFRGPLRDFRLNYKTSKGRRYFSLAGDWKYAFEIKTKVDATKLPKRSLNPDALKSPTSLYNGMIHPLIPLTIRGVIWYQGEANAGNAYRYRTLFPTLIKDWRKRWGAVEFPFYFVQLASFLKHQPRRPIPAKFYPVKPRGNAWAELREAQLMTIDAAPKTGMAVCIDIGSDNDIHPKKKEAVGIRLALIALAQEYGKKIVYSGPVYKSMKIDGRKIILSFKHVGSGLMTKNNEALKGFAIAGEDQKFVWAKAKIIGNTIVVSSNKITKPVAVRYAWDIWPTCNLFNKEALPATPFRTDSWKGITQR